MSINGTTTLNHSRNFLKLIVLEFESASTQQEKKNADYFKQHHFCLNCLLQQSPSLSKIKRAFSWI